MAAAVSGVHRRAIVLRLPMVYGPTITNLSDTPWTDAAGSANDDASTPPDLDFLAQTAAVTDLGTAGPPGGGLSARRGEGS
jgi:hypothetical protein